MAEYNLLPDDPNCPFAVVFDLYTPRPHFIVLPGEGKIIDPDFSKMDAKLTQQLIAVLSSFKIDSGILSIHRGSWRRGKSPGFHVHLCVSDAESYLKVFYQNYESIPHGCWPLSFRDMTAKDRKASYHKAVSEYPTSHFVKDVEALNNIKNGVAGNNYTPPSLRTLVSKAKYPPSEPKIGFIGRKTDSIPDLQDVLSVMELIASQKVLQDPNAGCHLCLYLGSAATQDWNISPNELKEGEDVLGYIVTNPYRFYQLCPADSRRQDWYDAFTKGAEFKCVT